MTPSQCSSNRGGQAVACDTTAPDDRSRPVRGSLVSFTIALVVDPLDVE